MTYPRLVICDLAHHYRMPVIDGLNLQVPPGAFFSLIGPNGCGKSTLLRIVAGLEQQTAGTVELQGRPLRAALDRGHRVGVVFQEPRLLPWRRLSDNVVLALRAADVGDREAHDRAARYLKLVHLEGFEHYFPSRISGGMQQRASIARALACEPDLLLMDEPFSALDAQNRRSMQDELVTLWRETGCTVLFVTHAIDEAIRLSTHVAVLTGRPMRVRWMTETSMTDPAGLHERMLALLSEEVVAQDHRSAPPDAVASEARTSEHSGDA